MSRGTQRRQEPKGSKHGDVFFLLKENYSETKWTALLVFKEDIILLGSNLAETVTPEGWGGCWELIVGTLQGAKFQHKCIAMCKISLSPQHHCWLPLGWISTVQYPNNCSISGLSCCYHAHLWYGTLTSKFFSENLTCRLHLPLADKAMVTLKRTFYV